MDDFFVAVRMRVPQIPSKKVYEWCKIHVVGYLNEQNLESIKEL